MKLCGNVPVTLRRKHGTLLRPGKVLWDVMLRGGIDVRWLHGQLSKYCSVCGFLEVHFVCGT